jgi:hypothetical protein
MKKRRLTGLTVGASLIACVVTLLPLTASADTPESVLRIDRYGDPEFAEGKGGDAPLAVQKKRPADPGAEIQRFEIGKSTIVIHSPTNVGVPAHDMGPGNVHGCHQWVYIPPTWYLVHCG